MKVCKFFAGLVTGEAWNYPINWVSLKSFLTMPAADNFAECEGVLSCINIFFSLKIFTCNTQKRSLREHTIIFWIYLDILINL